MPIVFRDRDFHFNSNEDDPREPPHVHGVGPEGDAKFWLFPDISVAYDRGFSARTQSELIKIIEARRDEIERAWNDHSS